MDISRIPWFHRIKVRVLLVGMLMSVIPALVIGMYIIYVTKHDLEKSVQSQNEAVAERYAQQLNFFLFRTEERLKTARFSLLASHTAEDKQAILYRMLKKIPLAEEAVVFDDRGRVEYGEHRFLVMDKLQEKEWQTDALLLTLTQKKEYYSPVQFQADHIPYLQVAVPIFSEDGKTFLGGVGVKVRLQSLFTQLEELGNKKKQVAFIVDAKGTLITHSDFSSILQEKKVNHSFIVKHFMDKGSAAALPIPNRYENSEQEEVLGVYSIVSRTGWGIVVEEPIESAFASIWALFLKLLAFLFLIILAAFLISILLGLSFTKPIEYLERAVRSVGRVQTREPVFTTRKDELGRLITVFGEMTERLDSQAKKLLQEKERLDAIVGGMGIGLALLTKDCRIVWKNPVLSDWIEGEGAQTDTLCYQTLKGTPVTCKRCPLQGSKAEGINADIITHLSLMNKEKVFRHNVYPLRHVAEGEPDYLLVIEDITEQRKMEEIAVQADKLSALGLMASGFAHEINNPLATIQVYAEDLADQTAAGQQHGDDVEEYLRIICKNVNRAKEITQKLLNFSRKSEWREENIHVPTVCQESISLLAYAFSKKQVEISCTVEPEIPYIRGDALQLTQVLINLLQNALDAVDRGGTVRIMVSSTAQNVQIAVIDDGSGIDPSDVGKVFDPFFTTKPVGQGTGLGLSICYGMITRMGGSIAVQSAAPQGTAIRIILPAVQREGLDGYKNTDTCS
ncbi:ATP-binding protein [Aneurinibacillus sp. REN35]|uniref:ATP-binding protein n=1 Tax=Aneurinibacillus sp. REN35 TaxID=3237286 RepID=UPI0035297FB9